MLDTRLYRVAFLPLLLAVLVAAFSLGERPRPIRTTLAPDAFDGARASALLTELARTFPNRRPGSPGDDALARRVATELERAGFAPSTTVTPAETVDGARELTTVVGERAGRDSRRIVVVAHRDAVSEDETARMSATAALVELARLYRGRATRRTLTFVSTSGGTGGMEGLRATIDRLPGPVDAAIVLGDVAGRGLRAPFVVPWSESSGVAPLRLRRTVEEAVRQETDVDPGSPRALVQLVRLAVPATTTAQGPFLADGISAVTVQASGERGPPPGAPVSAERLETFGRGVLRSISALDNGPDVPAGARQYLVARRQVVARWTVALLAAALLLPALLAAVDGLARVRRRRGAVMPWLRWIVAGAVPFLLVALVARLLGLTGLVASPSGAVDPAALPAEPVLPAALGLVLVLGLLVRAPLARLLGARAAPQPEEVPAASAAIAVALALLAAGVWAVNPYTALLLAPAVHLWLLAAAPEVRVPRAAALLMVAAALLPLVLVGAVYASAWGLDPLELMWVGVLLLASGTAGPLGVVVWSLVLGCGLSAVLVALRKRRTPAPPEENRPVSIRGPLTYAGPGSLGGTPSGLRR